MIWIAPESSAPITLRTRKSPRWNDLLVLVDHPADVQAVLDLLLVVGGELLEHLAEDLERGAAAELADDVLLGLGDDHGVADRPAALADDRPDRDRAAEQHGHGAVVKRLAVEHELVGPGDLAAAGHAADHPQAADLAVDQLEEIVGRNENGSPRRSSDGLLGVSRSSAQASRRLARLVQPERLGSSTPGQRDRPDGQGRRALDLPVLADDRLAGAAQDMAGQPLLLEAGGDPAELVGMMHGREDQVRSAVSPPSPASSCLEDLLERGVGGPRGGEGRDALHGRFSLGLETSRVERTESGAPYPDRADDRAGRRCVSPIMRVCISRLSVMRTNAI